MTELFDLSAVIYSTDKATFSDNIVVLVHGILTGKMIREGGLHTDDATIIAVCSDYLHAFHTDIRVEFDALLDQIAKSPVKKQ